MQNTVEKNSARRLQDWYNFRSVLETAEDPFELVHTYFQKQPKVKVYTDPYDQSTWPTAWELIDENEYCPFNLVLAVCYTLQLTERFSNIVPTIKIALDNQDKVVYYLLFVDDKVYGFSTDGWIHTKTLPKTLIDLKIYTMPPL